MRQADETQLPPHLDSLEANIAAAERKHGRFPLRSAPQCEHPLRILGEEYTEVAEAYGTSTLAEQCALGSALRRELLDVATAAMRWLRELDREFAARLRRGDGVRLQGPL